MIPTSLRTAAALAVLGTLLAGCSAGSEPADAPTSSAASPSSADPQPAPSSTLTAEEQQAVEEATAVVLAREQLFFELLADPSRSLNEMNSVVAEPQLDRDLANLQDLVISVREGRASVESTGPVRLSSAELVAIDLESSPPTVTLLLCVDRTAASGVQDDEAWSGRRESAQYQVVRTTYLPDPGWALNEVSPPEGHDQPQPC